MRVTQISKDIWFKGVWGELEPGGGGFPGTASRRVFGASSGFRVG